MNDNVDWEAAIWPVVEHVWKVIHERLVKLRDRLDPWLNGMLAGPIPANWREELARFAEQTRADGLVIRPEGMAVLEKTIQGRVDAEARQKQRATAVLAAPVASLPSSRTGTAMGSNKSPGRVAKSPGATFFNGDGERQRGAQVAALVEREVNGKTWVYFQKEPGGPWFGVTKKTYFLHDAAGNLLNDSFGIPRSARDLTGAKEVDWLTSTSLNHPADAGWAKIAKQYGGLLPIDPQELREDLSKSGSVAGPLIRYTAKTAAFVVIAGALAKGLGKGVEKGAEALLGRGEKEIVKHAVEETAKAGEAAKIAESAAGKQAVKSGEKAAQKAESALAKEAAAGESAAAKAEGHAQGGLGQEIGSKTWQEYEEGVRKLYGEISFESRTFSTLVDGKKVKAVADNVATIGGRNVAIEAKFVKEGWVNSLRNPASAIGNKPFAIAEQAKMLEQAKAYSKGFDEVIYHSNSPELIAHYAKVFKDAGIANIRFILTP